MNLGQEQEAFVKDVLKLVDMAIRDGYGVRFGEVERTVEQQKLYIQAGRSKTMNSMHLKRCAIDLILILDGKVATREQIRPLGDYWESLDSKNRWGGNWRGLVDAGKSSFVDAPHFERAV